MRLQEIDQRLVQVLTDAGDEWGQLGVLLAAFEVFQTRHLTEALNQREMTHDDASHNQPSLLD